jgi:hypothetical protein
MTKEAKATIRAFEKRQSELKNLVVAKLRSISNDDRTSALVEAGVLTKSGKLAHYYRR